MTCPISLSKQKAEQDLSPGLLLLPLGVRLCAHMGCEDKERAPGTRPLSGRQAYLRGTNEPDEVSVW